MNYYNYLFEVGESYNNEAACVLSAISFLKRIPAVKMPSHGRCHFQLNTFLNEELLRINNLMGVTTQFSLRRFDEIPFLGTPLVLKVVNPMTLSFYYLTLFDFYEGAFVTGNPLTGTIDYYLPDKLASIWPSGECVFVYRNILAS